ncbi:MAG: 50S ribosomal protein L10 [Tissierellia bacterium]|nr:50S ribosomal protein L10 [Tissierellia bacterium]
MKEQILQAKKDVVAEILGNINNAQAMVLVEYRGLTVAELTELRKKYRESGVNYKVYKNTMMQLAFKEAGLEDFCEHLTGPNAIAFGMDDPASVAKITQDFAKEHEKLIIKAGVVDGEVIGLDKIKSLASLPSKEVLIAQVLGGLNAPIQGFANVLNGTLSSLVYALNAIKEQKEEAA